MTKLRVAINGLGRIGRLAFRILYDSNKVDLVGVNDLAVNETLAYLLKYDTAQRKWEHDLKADSKNIYIDGKAIPCSAEKDPSLLPWKKKKVDVVVECTGFFRSAEKASLHLKAGAKKVVISAPGKGDLRTIVLGVNDEELLSSDTIISNASCTTNCLAPMVKVLDEICGIKDAYMSTIHAYTGNQKLQDSIHRKDLRRGRAAAINMVPTTSNATSTLELVMPKMKGKLQGGAVRVPTITGSLTELYCNVTKTAEVKIINKAFKTASKKDLKGILAYTEDPIVSWDIVHDAHSCIFDASLTKVMGRHIKIVGWYDNEYGYANRLSELVLKVGSIK